MAAAPLRLGLILACGLAAAGCKSDGPRPQGPRPIPTAPDRGHVYEAVLRLGDRLHALYRTWPAHIACASDDPNIPLVEVREVENRGEIDGVDLEALGWELAQQLRTQGRLRLLSDEPTVVSGLDGGGPPSLGDNSSEANLVVFPWVDSAGRFCILLQDDVKDQTVVVARSDMPTPLKPEVE